MYFYSIYIGNYYIFLLTASNWKPVRLEFKDHETDIRGITSSYPWREKVYLYPAILQRKWIDYRVKGKFIPQVNFDNVLPCSFQYGFPISTHEATELRIACTDKEYRHAVVHIINEEGTPVYERMVGNLSRHSESSLMLRMKKPGVYRISMTAEERRYRSSYIIVCERTHQLDTERALQKNTRFFCCRCKSIISPIEAGKISRYIYKNYIPFKEYVDLDNLGMEFISDFIKRLPHPVKYKRGLVHLLNIIRMASVEDEIEIITSLYSEDPSFAHFVTNRLFLFSMLPLMGKRELQRILATVDDSLIARSLIDEGSVIRDTVFQNISRRRAQIVRTEMLRLKVHKRDMNAREEINRTIKTYFEEHYGRIIKIPTGDLPVHVVKSFDRGQSYLNSMGYHSGDYLVVQGEQIFLHQCSHEEQICRQYDTESFLDEIFCIFGISEGSIYLKSAMGIRYVLIHMYYWSSSLESSDFFENISKNMIIPLSYLSNGIVLTIGAIDGKGVPHEQVIRLNIK